MAVASLLFFTFIVALSMQKDTRFFCSADPADGFTAVPLTERNLHMQWPYNLKLSERYSFVNGVRSLWVYSTDKPFNSGTRTKPRTEIRIRTNLWENDFKRIVLVLKDKQQGYDYSSGVWQFEGYAYVPSNTSGATIVQIHRTTGASTVFMLDAVEGDLRYYHSSLVESNIYDKWMRINVIHDVDADKITVYINGVQKLEIEGNGPNTFYFKCGVYAQVDESHYMESRWRDIKILKK